MTSRRVSIRPSEEPQSISISRGNYLLGRGLEPSPVGCHQVRSSKWVRVQCRLAAGSTEGNPLFFLGLRHVADVIRFTQTSCALFWTFRHISIPMIHQLQCVSSGPLTPVMKSMVIGASDPLTANRAPWKHLCDAALFWLLWTSPFCWMPSRWASR